MEDITGDSDFDVDEIHELCSGRPYEIQLICHAMFRRLQSKRAAKMALDFAVIEDVRKELETSQDISVRPIIQKVRRLDENQLEALSLLTAAEGHAEFSEVWKIQYVFPTGSRRYAKEELEHYLDYLVEVEILKIQNNVITFEGDDFDRIYLKYFAREKDISLSIVSLPLRLVWQLHIDTLVISNKGIFLGNSPDVYSRFDIAAVVELIREDHTEDIFVSEPTGARSIYYMMMANRGRENADIIDLRLICDDITVVRRFYLIDPSNDDWSATIQNSLQVISERLMEINGSLEVTYQLIPILEIDKLAHAVLLTKNQNMRDKIATWHVSHAVDAYMENDMQEAKFHAILADRYRFNGDAADLINLGYLFMADNQTEIARRYWLNAIEMASKPYDAALARYDLAILEITEGKIEAALEKLKECIEKVSALKREEQECFSLFKPIFTEESVKIEETRNDPFLLDTALQVKRQLETIYPTIANTDNSQG